MRSTLYALTCFVVVQCCSAVAFADPDYYQALDGADAAVALGDFAGAARAIQGASRKYPGDYALTLKLAWVQLQWAHYSDSEQSFRTASELSDGSLDSRIGLGWALIQQDRCEEGVRVLRDVLAEESDQTAERGLWICADRKRVHGSIWTSLGGSLYQNHPWMHMAGSAFLGFKLQPSRVFAFGGAYRLARLSATDMRIPSFTQHEAYLEAGYSGKWTDLMLHGALVWGGDAVVGGSRHVGTSFRLKLTSYVREVVVEAAGSFYDDLWMISLAPSSTLGFGPWSLTLGVSAQQFAHETLVSASLTSALTFASVSVWAGGKYGPEYRAVYLSQFGIFNAQERSTWALLGGVRVQTSLQVSLFASYALLRLESPDEVMSTLHSLSLGVAFAL